MAAITFPSPPAFVEVLPKLKKAEAHLLRSDYAPYLDLVELRKSESRSEEFRALFTRFYGLRAPRKWADKFFKRLQTDPDLGELPKLMDETGTISFKNREVTSISFLSKMLAIVDPQIPIYDVHVRGFLRLAHPKSDHAAWLGAFIDHTAEAYLGWADQPEFQDLQERFQRRNHELGTLHPIRQIDLLIWRYGRLEAYEKSREKRIAEAKNARVQTTP